MIFTKENIDKIEKGIKIQTRRIRKRYEYATNTLSDGTIPLNAPKIFCVRTSGNKLKWQVGKEYSVQENRTSKGGSKIKLTEIGLEKLLDITDKDAKKEGHKTRNEFLTEFYAINKRYFKAGTNPEVWVLTFKKV